MTVVLLLVVGVDGGGEGARVRDEPGAGAYSLDLLGASALL